MFDLRLKKKKIVNTIFSIVLFCFYFEKEKKNIIVNANAVKSYVELFEVDWLLY